MALSPFVGRRYHCGRLVLFFDNLVVVIGILKECRKGPSMTEILRRSPKAIANHAGLLWQFGVVSQREYVTAPVAGALAGDDLGLSR